MNDSIEPQYQLSSYRFDIPAHLIARYPLEERTASRLLVLKKDAPKPEHQQFPDVLGLLNAGDVLVLNNTRVIPARLFAQRAETGGRVEVLLGRKERDGTHLALVQPARRIKAGTRLVFGGIALGKDDPFFATVEERDGREMGAFRLRFEGNAILYAEENGQIPLPPYLQRDAEEVDKTRYQTVFASDEQRGASAAPTAGLHFSEELLLQLRQKGVELAEVTLHVGPGTFLPVRSQDIRGHDMHFEPWEMTASSAALLNAAKKEGRRIIAVGTTAMRVLESAYLSEHDVHFREDNGITNLFIYPGYSFHAVDALLTNFHLPESSLILLAAAFVGKDRLLAAYQEAIEDSYRFFSYGDCCFFENASENA
jgi:S-adenosylmethionine:tRNA ribosyltransferase-isomerase